MRQLVIKARGFIYLAMLPFMVFNFRWTHASISSQFSFAAKSWPRQNLLKVSSRFVSGVFSISYLSGNRLTSIIEVFGKLRPYFELWKSFRSLFEVACSLAKFRTKSHKIQFKYVDPSQNNWNTSKLAHLAKVGNLPDFFTLTSCYL